MNNKIKLYTCMYLFINTFGFSHFAYASNDEQKPDALPNSGQLICSTGLAQENVAEQAALIGLSEHDPDIHNLQLADYCLSHPVLSPPRTKPKSALRHTSTPTLAKKEASTIEAPNNLSTRIEFTDLSDIEHYDLYSLNTTNAFNGDTLTFNDLVLGNVHNMGILSQYAYTGDLDVILAYKDHQILTTGYQAQIKLLLAHNDYIWNEKKNHVAASHKIYSSLDYSWFYLNNLQFNHWGRANKGRLQKGFLRLTRKDGYINAYYFANNQWNSYTHSAQDLISETSPLRIGIQMYAFYNDLYSAKFDFLQIANDVDKDGLNDVEEKYMGLDPENNDSDGDGIIDGLDSFPLQSHLSAEVVEQSYDDLFISGFYEYGLDRWVIVQNNTTEPLTTIAQITDLAQELPVEDVNGNLNYSISQGFTIENLKPFERRIYKINAVPRSDLDNDGILSQHDNCPLVFNIDQQDTDNDKLGDVCDEDIDGDGMSNVWETANALDPYDKQDGNSDLDNDGISNLIEFEDGTDPSNATDNNDTDQDGVHLNTDNCLLIANPDQLDSDEDGLGNACDDDDDNDGMDDVWEIANGLNPLDASDYNHDNDNDGFINIDEYRQGYNPLDYASSPHPTYPSTLTSWVIPGNYQTPTDSNTITTLGSTLDDVINWEINHADISFGGDYGSRNTELSAVIGYKYHQKLEFNPTDLEMYLRSRAETDKKDYEDFFLHFAEDTVLNVGNPNHGISTPLYGRPTIMGYTTKQNDRGTGVNFPSSVGRDVWRYSYNNGSFYVGLFEKFDELAFELDQLSSDGSITIEYPSIIDKQGLVTQWSPITVNSDTTQNMTQDGSLRWTPPTNWQRAALYDVANQQGSAIGSTMLLKGYRYYLVRISLNNNSSQLPTLKNVSLKRWITAVTADKKQQKILGWDDKNDIDNNGYIDDSEFAQRKNTQASARFRYEARLYPIGAMWGASSSHARPDLSNEKLIKYVGDYYADLWSSRHFTGAYNDSLFRMLDSNVFDVVSGGDITELSRNLTDAEAQEQYEQDFATLLKKVRRRTSTNWNSANISGVNLYTKASYIKFVDALDAVLREDYLHSTLGLSGFFGLNKAWDTFALAADNKKSIIMAMNKSGRSIKKANTEAHWQMDIESGLAQYYLLNVVGHTYYQAWNSSFVYGSGNTISSGHSFWKAGVPKNYAYQPSAMLSVDIGVPSNVIPEGKAAMQYMIKTAFPSSDYTIIGDTTDTVLTHPEIGKNGNVSVIPSYIYHLTSSTSNVVSGGPSETVLARDYSNGLVLYRTNFFGNNATFMDTLSDPIALPGTYKRLNFDGSLGDAVTHITLKGYEGAILIKAD